MSVRWSYTPGRVDLPLRLHAGAVVAVELAAEDLLRASQELIPVDTGALRDSGKISADGTQAAVSYGFEDAAGRSGANTGDYAIVQHEDMALNHPGGGVPKFLEIPMHNEAAAIRVLIAETLRKALS